MINLSTACTILVNQFKHVSRENPSVCIRHSCCLGKVSTFLCWGNVKIKGPLFYLNCSQNFITFALNLMLLLATVRAVSSCLVPAATLERAQCSRFYYKELELWNLLFIEWVSYWSFPYILSVKEFHSTHYRPCF